MMPGAARRIVLAAFTVTLLSAPDAVPAQQPARPARPPAQGPTDPHADGTPEGWKFTLPKGDPAKGREVFAKLVALLLSGALAACNRTDTERTAANDPFDTLELLRTKIVTPSRDFTLPGLTEQPVRLVDCRGQVVLLNFWATWCPPCKEEMPSMEGLYHRYRDRGFTIVAVSTDTGGVPTVAAFARALKLTFPIALDPDMAVANEYRVAALPTTFLIDQDANIVARAVGPRDWDSQAARALIESLFR